MGTHEKPGRALKRLAIVIVAIGLFTQPYVGTRAQAPPGAKPTFEVVSLKENRDNTPGPVMFRPDGGFIATNVSLRLMLQTAYAYGSNRQLLYSFQIAGGPSWIDGDRWDIDARGGGARSMAEVQLRLQALLEDRFKLKIRPETRELPIYSLVLARGDGRLGPSLRPSTLKCPPPGSEPPLQGSPEADCGLRNVTGRMTARGVELSALAAMLGGFPPVARMTYDTTGLSGAFDWDLEWTPTVARSIQAGGDGIAPEPSPTGTPLLTAIQEQLGLKLEGGRAPVEVFVVESVEKPVEN